MIREKLGFAARRFLISLLFLAGVSVLLHSVEIVAVIISKQVSFSFLLLLQAVANDIAFVAHFAAYTFVIYFIIYLASDFSARMLMAFMLLLIVINQIGLMQYYLVSHVPLGADFWNYSLNDIKLTIKASADVKWWQILAFPMVVGFAMRMHYAMQQYTLPLYTSLGIIGAILLIGFLPINFSFDEVGAKNLALNKADYFLTKSKDFYVEQRGNDGVNSLIVGANAMYPFQTKQNPTDNFGKYFKKGNKPPNIVMVLVEGLGKTFLGPQAEYEGTMPFMDSLSRKSLCWTNFLSTTGRTFGVLPSVLGSLPFGASGFMEMGNDVPYHTSLVKLLKQNGYRTGFYYGGDATFDGQQLFLQKQGIDFVLDEKDFPESYKKIPANSGGFSWGYPDKELYRRSLEVLPDTTPYLSVYLTVTTHEPFKFEGSEAYNSRINQLLLQYNNNPNIAENKDAFKTLMYADDALRYLIESYKNRPEYENTIFIITGDHRMIPVKHINELDRYHVPLIVYSPMLKSPKEFKSICSHADLPSTLTAYLQKQYRLTFPDSVHWLGQGLTFKNTFQSDRQMAIMRNKGDISEYVYGEYFITDGALLTIGDNCTLTRNPDEDLRAKVAEQLNQFKQLNNYVCKFNKLYNVKNTFISTMPTTNDSNDLNEIMIEEPVAVESAKTEKVQPIITQKAQKPEPKNRQPQSGKSNKGEAAFIMGKVHAELNNPKQARQLLQQALQNNYKVKDAYRLLINLELGLDNKVGALKWYNQAITQIDKASFNDLYKKITAK